jgi:hypothetical protein
MNKEEIELRRKYKYAFAEWEGELYLQNEIEEVNNK